MHLSPVPQDPEGKRLKSWYLSCQSLLDFSSFFLLCLVIPFCERLKQGKKKRKKNGVRLSSFCWGSELPASTFLVAETGYQGHLMARLVFLHLASHAQTVVSLPHRDTDTKGSFAHDPALLRVQTPRIRSAVHFTCRRSGRQRSFPPSPTTKYLPSVCIVTSRSIDNMRKFF